MGGVRPVAIYGLGKRGVDLARAVGRALGGQVMVPAGMEREGEQGFESLRRGLERNFRAYRGHVLVCAVGIAVRVVGPLLRSKFLDPAVVVIDQAGQWAVSLVGGHLGGANELAMELAEKMDLQAVITTATDAQALPALEVLARDLGLGLANPKALARVAGALVDGEVVGVWDPGGWVWPVLRKWEGAVVRVESTRGWEEGELVWVDWRELEPPDGWVVMRPRCLAVGLGCHERVQKGELREALEQTLARAGLSPQSLWRLASLEARARLGGFRALARELGAELVGYSPQELRGVDVPNPSAAVAEAVGTPSVCEAAAILASGGGRLVVGKCKVGQVTVAVALAGAGACG